MPHVTHNAGEIIRRFDRLPTEIQTSVLSRVRGALIVTVQRVRSGTGVKWQRLGRGLAGRLTSYADRAPLMGLDAAVGFRKTTGFPYELAQEFGARAKAGKALAIPVSAKAKALSERGIGPRGFPGKLFIPPHMHILAEAYKRGGQKGGLKQVHYALVKSIPARLRFREIAEGSLPMISAEIEAGGKEGLKKA